MTEKELELLVNKPYLLSKEHFYASIRLAMTLGFDYEIGTEETIDFDSDLNRYNSKVGVTLEKSRHLKITFKNLRPIIIDDEDMWNKSKSLATHMFRQWSVSK